MYIYIKDLRFLKKVAMKNAIAWDIQIQFVPHRRHFTSPLRAQPVNAM
jgi:hypothetical protein